MREKERERERERKRERERAREKERERERKRERYCIEGISETTDASADFYCQSNTNNLTRTSCTFYVKSLQVNHSQNTQKERARYYGMGREGERRDGGRGYSVGFIEDSYFWF